MTPQEMANAMRDIDSGDQEGDHCDADDLMVRVLRSLGYGEAMDIYEKMDKWYA